jgi:tetratricopeptide (TPR) repeat protein
MKQWLKISLFLLLSGISTELKAYHKDTTDISSRRLLRLARQDMALEMYNDAAFYYKTYYNRHKNDIDLAYKLAELYRKLGKFKEAATLYAAVCSAQQKHNILNKAYKEYFSDVYQHEKKYPLALYYYALMRKRCGDYELSIIDFKKFIDEYEEDNRDYYRKLAMEEMEGCKLAIKLMSEPETVFPRQFSERNYSRSIFSPTFLNDSEILYFELLKGDFSYGLRFHCTLSTARSIQDMWFGGKPVSADINKSENLLDGGCFSADHKTFYFTSTNVKYYIPPYPKLLNGYIADHIRMYSVNYNNGKWGFPTMLDKNINLPGTINIMPNLSTDNEGNEVMYFVSDRPGGSGGYDIWKAVRRKNSREFYDPVNLGPMINTAEDEVTPFMDEGHKTLYFSTTARPGMGGFDIFSSNMIAVAGRSL